MDIIVLTIASIVWGAVLVGAATVLQTTTSLAGAGRQMLWRIAAVLLIAPWVAAPLADLAGIGLPAAEPVVVEPAPVTDPMENEVPAMDLVAIVEPAATVAPPVAPAAPIPWMAILAGAIVAGWAWRLVAARMAAGSLKRIVAKSAEAGPGPARQSLVDWSRRLKLGRSPSLRIVVAGLSPFSFGVVRPVICLPEGLDRQLDREALDLVVGHECLHTARGDGWLRPVERLAADLLWFNPFAWRIRRELDVARELACDEAVLRHVRAHRAYAHTLRNVASIAAGLGAAVPATSMSLSGSPRSLMLRMKQALAGPRTKPARMALASVVAFALAGALAACMQGVVAAPRVEATPRPVAEAPVIPVTAPAGKFPRLEGDTRPLLKIPTRVTSGYGLVTDPFTGRQAFHEGVDLRGPMRTPVHTPLGGTILFADERGTMGNVVEVDLGNSQMIRFTHLETIDVREGAAVSAGDVVGMIGSTGRSTGPHLHVEFYWKGKTYDPTKVENLIFSTSLEQQASAPPQTQAAQPAQSQPTRTILRLNGKTSPILQQPARVIGGFGYRADRFTGTMAFHPGIDLAATLDAPIYSPADGVVAFTGVKGGRGRAVELKISDSEVLLFGHLNTIGVTNGAQIRAGDEIGTMGSTGRSTGPHLHFEYLRDGKNYDPQLVENLVLATSLEIDLQVAPPVPPAPDVAPQQVPAPVREIKAWYPGRVTIAEPARLLPGFRIKLAQTADTADQSGCETDMEGLAEVRMQAGQEFKVGDIIGRGVYGKFSLGEQCQRTSSTVLDAAFPDRAAAQERRFSNGTLSAIRRSGFDPSMPVREIRAWYPAKVMVADGSAETGYKLRLVQTRNTDTVSDCTVTLSNMQSLQAKLGQTLTEGDVIGTGAPDNMTFQAACRESTAATGRSSLLDAFPELRQPRSEQVRAMPGFPAPATIGSNGHGAGPIPAPFDARVAKVERVGELFAVEIEATEDPLRRGGQLGEGCTARLVGLAEVNVTEGATIAAGQTIGRQDAPDDFTTRCKSVRAAN